MKTETQNNKKGLQSRSEQLSTATIDLNAPTTLNNTGKWHGIFFDGPQADQNSDGDEIPAWVVYVGDEDAEPTGTVYKFHNFKPAEQLAKRMSNDRRLELIHEASPA